MAASRREFLRSTGAALAAGGVVGLPRLTRGQTRPGVPSDPVKIGVLAAGRRTAPVGQAGLRGTQWWTDPEPGRWHSRPQIELVVEEESNPKDTVERFRKLALQDKVDVIIGVISTGVGLALGPVAEEMETLARLGRHHPERRRGDDPQPRSAFRSVDNEAEAIMAASSPPEYLRAIKTIAGINNDYSYGRDNWAAFLAVSRVTAWT